MRSKAKQAREAEQAPARVKALTGSMAAPTAKKTSRNSVYLFAIALFLTSGGLFAFLVWNASRPWPFWAGCSSGPGGLGVPFASLRSGSVSWFCA